MRIREKFLLIASVVLLAAGAWGQHVYQPKVLARLSYDNSAMSRGDVRHVCVAVSLDGWYRIVRTAENGQILRGQGKLPEDQFQQLKKSLNSKGFRNLSKSDGGLILQDAEIFAAELPGPVDFDGPEPPFADHAQRLRWLNPDGASPFPAAIVPVVNWLKRFEPKDVKPFEYTEFQDACPSVGLSLLQPSVATNSPR